MKEPSIEIPIVPGFFIYHQFFLFVNNLVNLSWPNYKRFKEELLYKPSMVYCTGRVSTKTASETLHNFSFGLV